MQKIILLGIFVVINYGAFSQKTKEIKGTSEAITFRFNPEPGLPPNLKSELTFFETDGDNCLNAGESAEIRLKIINEGKGPAYKVKVYVKDNIGDSTLTIEDGIELPCIFPRQVVNVRVPISASEKVKSTERKLIVSVTEKNNYNMDNAEIIFETVELKKPKLFFAGAEIIENINIHTIIKDDGKIQKGEAVETKITIQNIGETISKETKFLIASKDKNLSLGFYNTDRKIEMVKMEPVEGIIGDIDVNKTMSFSVIVSPNKIIQQDSLLPLYLSLFNSNGHGGCENIQIPLALDMSPPSIQTKKIKPQKKKKEIIISNPDKITEIKKAKLDEVNIVPDYQFKRNSHSLAIVIGIEKYKHIPIAPYATKDAEIISEYFKKALGIETVLTFTDNQIDKTFFRDKFNSVNGDIKGLIRPGETDLFVFYSGHGIPPPDGDEVFLFPPQGKIKHLSTHGYGISILCSELNALGAKSVTLFMDACFSGSSRTSKQHKETYLLGSKGAEIKSNNIMQGWEDNEDFIVFSSSRFNQLSFGYDLAEKGMFTHFICAGLKGAADLNPKDNKITTGELADYLLEKVTDTARKEIDGAEQTPRFHGKRDVVLLKLK